MKQQTFTVPSGAMFDVMEAKLAEMKASFPAWKQGIVDDIVIYRDRPKGSLDRRQAAHQIARNASDLITDLETALAEAREIQQRTPSVRDIPVTLPVHKPAAGWVYFAVRHADRAIKIGYSKNPSERLKSFHSGSGPCTLVAEMPGNLEHETELHRRFAASRIGGEWFRRTDELVALIRKWPLL